MIKFVLKSMGYQRGGYRMVLVSASSLQKDFGGRSLFGGVSFDISDRDLSLIHI